MVAVCLQFFTGESMNPEGMVGLLDYREDGITPFMLFFKDGLEIEKCVSAMKWERLDTFLKLQSVSAGEHPYATVHTLIQSGFLNECSVFVKSCLLSTWV